ncbi:hypothetical protein [Actinokineospora pegani]|uniref:hypothetical protein n=1 Tax=Actinokineospora pegani TaxID=2654637 RepID=UPI0022A75FE0|nr:hypothetical protein [Actinokineospora pegani]
MGARPVTTHHDRPSTASIADATRTGTHERDDRGTEQHTSRGLDPTQTDRHDPRAAAPQQNAAPGAPGQHGSSPAHHGSDASGRHTPNTDEIPAQQESRQAGRPAATDADEPGLELFGTERVEGFRTEWSRVQAAFVDDPKAAVTGADQLVAEVMHDLARTFAEHKKGLEGQWQGSGEAQTEDLRLALRRYRSFFNQLLHTP